MTGREALVDIAHSTAEAVHGLLEQLCGEDVVKGSVAVVPKGADPLAMLRAPLMVADVSYVDGVSGGNLFATTAAGALHLAKAMVGDGGLGDAGDADGLSEIGLSAVGEAMNQMMAAAAAATGAVLGEEVEIAAPRTRVVHTTAEALSELQQSANRTSVSFEIGGEPCRLIQVIPAAFVLRIERAKQDEQARAAFAAAPQGEGANDEVARSLRDVKLRVWAELGRTRMRSREAVSLAPGTVVDLDRAIDDPVELYVNGCSFASGRLGLDDEGNWTVEIVEIQPAAALGENVL